MDNDQIQDIQEIQAQFLEEALEYLNTMESCLLGIASTSLKTETIDQILRSAHSIKGGAAMMSFQDLSEVAHCLEDFFKIIKTGRISLNNKLERFFLTAVDRLREIINIYKQGKTIDSQWIEKRIAPILTKLHEDLGDLTPEDEEALLKIKNQADEEDMSVFLFETEVESCLTQLEEMIAKNDFTSLTSELERITQDLEGLGEMLELPNFSQLCDSIQLALQENPDQIETISKRAFEELRRSQALIFANQKDLLPSEFILNKAPTSSTNQESLDNSSNTTEVQEEDLADLSQLSSIDMINELFQDTELLETTLEETVLDLSPLESITTQIQSSSSTIDKQNQTSSFTKIDIDKDAQSDSTESSIRVSLSKIEELSNLFGELTIGRNRLGLQVNNIRSILNFLREKVNKLEKSNLQLRTVSDQIALIPDKLTVEESISESFDSLEMDNYNELHPISGEIMEGVVQIKEATNDLEIYLTEAEKINREFSRTSKLMQTSLNEVNMRPLSDLLKRFPRALRDMELIYNKKVDLVVKGGSTLIEKNVLESLQEPLLHLLRNAFDHGIETPETRKKLGKPEKGIIEISASHKGNRTIINIRDDGKGIDLNKIRVKGKKMGLEEEDLAQASEKEILDLIFEPGFTTTDKVTDLSGRGVGMDVVRSNLEDVKGEIMVETTTNVGTNFILSIPFSLTVIKVLIVECQKILLAFPNNQIEEVNLFNPNIVIRSAGQEFLNWEDNTMRLIKLEKYFNFAYSEPTLNIEQTPVINEPTLLMIEHLNKLVALKVDRYWGEQEVIIRKIEGNLRMPPGFTHCTILGDGKVVPIMDSVELIKWIDEQTAQLSYSLSSNQNSKIFHSQDNQVISDDENENENENTLKPTKKTNIMIIDDSINVRRFLALTLNKENYNVEQAKDGQDALEKLEDFDSIQAIICDIEMPRLDGFGFLAQVKSKSLFKDIPVIMLTSRIGEKHRKMAMNLGASAYFSKPFKEKELLAMIKKLTVMGEGNRE